MDLGFGERVPGLRGDGRQLRAPAVNERVVRAAAGITLVIGAVAFSYAYFAKQYAPLQAAASLFCLEFLLRVTVGIRRSPVGLLARAMTLGSAARVGVREAQALRVDPGAGDGHRDDDHHQ